VLHTLVNEARDGMTATAVAIACERDPDEPDHLDEIQAALRLLLEDGLAERETAPRGETRAAYKPDTAQEPGPAHKPGTAQEPDTPPQTLYRPTRAAIRAYELSF
jgi:hypothetical protein